MDPVTQEQEGTYQMKKTSPFADAPYDSIYTREPVCTVKEVRQRSKGPWGMLGVAAVLLVVMCGICLFVANVIRRDYQKQLQDLQASMNAQIQALQDEMEKMEPVWSVPPQNGGNQTPLEGQLTPGQIYALNADAVVAVTADAESSDSYYGGTVRSAGTGFLISSDGYVVTNYHVIADSTTQTVTLTDGKEYPAQIIGSDSDNDIALLKIEGENLPWVAFGSSDELNIGDQVVVIGHPLGNEEPTLTAGYVSAKDVLVSGDGSGIYMLQTDAAINSGNSGGPLFNMYGQVVGITTAKFSGYSSSGASIEGMGFALPADDVAPMLADLKEFGYVTGAYLGVYVRDVDSVTQSYGVPAGAYVEEVTEGFAAEKYGLRAGDVIVAVDSWDVGSVTELTRVLRKYNAGDEVLIRVWREGRHERVKLVLDEKPQQTPQQTVPDETLPDETLPQEGMPEEGDYWEWYDYLAPFFGRG